MVSGRIDPARARQDAAIADIEPFHAVHLAVGIDDAGARIGAGDHGVNRVFTANDVLAAYEDHWFGTQKVAGTIIWATDIREEKHTNT